MGWFHVAKTSRTEPTSSFEGRMFAQVIRNEPDLAKAMKQREYDLAPSLVRVSQRLPKLQEMDKQADIDAFNRALRSGYTKDEAMSLITRLRNNRDKERGEKAKLFAQIKQDQENKKRKVA